MQFQLTVSDIDQWHCCLGVKPNGLHFLSLSFQWCWNQPLSREALGGDGWWLVTEAEIGVNLLSRPRELLCSTVVFSELESRKNVLYGEGSACSVGIKKNNISIFSTII